MKKLIWKINNENENGLHCGKIYNRPQNWIPNIDQCMKRRKEWY